MILSGLRVDSAPCASDGSRVAQHVVSDPEGMKAVVADYWGGRSSRRCRMPSSCRRWTRSWTSMCSSERWWSSRNLLSELSKGGELIICVVNHGKDDTLCQPEVLVTRLHVTLEFEDIRIFAPKIDPIVTKFKLF